MVFYHAVIVLLDVVSFRIVLEQHNSVNKDEHSTFKTVIFDFDVTLVLHDVIKFSDVA